MAITENTIRNRWAFPARLGLVQHIGCIRRILAARKRRRIYREDLERLLCVGEYMIRDIGLTPDAARREIEKHSRQSD